MAFPAAPIDNQLHKTHIYDESIQAWRSAFSAEDYLDNLVSHWKFEDSGNTLIDSAGGNHGSISGATWVDESFSNRYLSFDGINDVVTIGNPASLRFSGSFTIMLWYYCDTVTADGGGLIQKKSSNGWSGTDYGIVRRLPDSLNFTVAGSGGSSTSVSLGISRRMWTHVAGVFDVGSMTLSGYQNGQRQNERDASSSITLPLKTNGDLTIGGDWYSDGSSPYYDGSIDDVRIYSAALTAEQIRNIYMYRHTLYSIQSA